MAKNALQAQLLKAGLTDSKQVKKTNANQAHQKRAGRATEHDVIRASVEDKAEERRRADQQLAEATRLEREQHEHTQRLIQILNRHAVNRQHGDSAYQFIDQGKIKKLYFSSQQYQQLVNGQLIIARSPEDTETPYRLLPYPLNDRIDTLWPDTIVVNNRKIDSNTDSSNEDDPYATYVIPDDLMW